MQQETVVNSKPIKGEHDVGKWTGAFMVFMGAIFLMGAFGITFAGRSPWVLMALLPVYWIGMAAYRCYQEEGRLTRRVIGIAIFAVLPLTYMTALVLGYPVSGLWPLSIIAVGVAFILLGSSK